jgi:hypothetical protein
MTNPRDYFDRIIKVDGKYHILSYVLYDEGIYRELVDEELYNTPKHFLEEARVIYFDYLGRTLSE